MSALDTQVGGDHYKSMPIQPMQYSMKNGLDACQHTIIKYVTRFREKGGIQDLEKAKHVIDMLIEFEAEGHKERDTEELDPGIQKAFEEMIAAVAAEKVDDPNCDCPICQFESAVQKMMPGATVRVVGAGQEKTKGKK